MRTIAIAAMVLFFGSASYAGPCLPGSLQDYINLGSTGCSQGLVQFTDFLIAPGQSFADPILPSTVQVTPGGTSTVPSLTFTLNRTGLAEQLLEAFFHFQVTGPQLQAASILLAGSAADDGLVIGSLDVCAGGFFAGDSPTGCTGTAGTLVTAFASGLSAPSDFGPFPVSSFFDIFADLAIDGGLGGTATLNSATIAVTSTPEPSTVLLVLTGIAAATLRRRRR